VVFKKNTIFCSSSFGVLMAKKVLEFFVFFVIITNMDRRNYMEKMVEDILTEIFDAYSEFEDCKLYREEIIALALTKCEPFYTTSDLGHAVVKTRMDSSGFRSKVTSIVLEAIGQVKKNPRR
jgi:hypothetical protein